MSELDFFPALELKLAADDAAGVVSGYAAVYGNRDLGGDVIQAGAFTATLAEHVKTRSMPAMLWSHDPSQPIGIWEDMREDEKGLRVVGRLNLGVQRAREARALAKQGAATGLSIGYRVGRDGASYSGGSRLLKAVDLVEVSLVTLPMNPEARLLDVKSIGTRRDFERFLRDQGFAGRAAAKIAAGGWPALGNEHETQTDEAVAALVKRIEAARLELKG